MKKSGGTVTHLPYVMARWPPQQIPTLNFLGTAVIQQPYVIALCVCMQSTNFSTKKCRNGPVSKCWIEVIHQDFNFTLFHPQDTRTCLAYNPWDGSLRKSPRFPIKTLWKSQKSAGLPDILITKFAGLPGNSPVGTGGPAVKLILAYTIKTILSNSLLLFRNES